MTPSLTCHIGFQELLIAAWNCSQCSLLAGEGSAMAMAAAYTLAGELDAAGGSYGRAFAAYEQRLPPYVERKQKGARGFAASFVPKTAARLWLQNLSINAVTHLGLTRLLLGPQLGDPLKLADYRQARPPALAGSVAVSADRS